MSLTSNLYEWPIAVLRRAPLHEALAAVLLLGAMPATAFTASITVTSPDDAVHTGTCTLRQAILSMNTGAVAGTGPARARRLRHATSAPWKPIRSPI